MSAAPDTDTATATRQAAPSVADRFRLANELLQRGDLTAAVAEYTTLVADRPQSGELLVKLADAKARLGERDEALGLLQRALKINDGLVWAHIGLAKLRGAEGDHDAAIADLERALQCKNVPRFATLELVRQFLAAGRAAVSAKRFDTAEQQFRTALDHARVDPALELQARCDLVDLLVLETRYELALAVLKPVEEKAPMKKEMLLNRVTHASAGRILVADGRQDDEGNALLLLDALRLAVPDLGRTWVRFVNISDPDVRSKVESLAWETGLQVLITSAPPEQTLEGCACLLAVARRSTAHLQPLRTEAARRGIPTLIAVEDCTEVEAAEVWALAPRARDPQALAQRIVAMQPA